MTSYSWTAGSGSWGTAANWTPSGVPALGDNVTFATGPLRTFTVDGPGAAASITVAGDAVTFTGTIDAGTAAGGTMDGLDMQAGSLTIAPDATLEMAYDEEDSSSVFGNVNFAIGSTASLQINGTVDSFGGAMESGSIAVAGAGAGWYGFNDMTLAGSAVVTVTDGAATTVNFNLDGGGTLALDDTAAASHAGVLATSGGLVEAIDTAGQTAPGTVVLQGIAIAQGETGTQVAGTTLTALVIDSVTGSLGQAPGGPLGIAGGRVAIGSVQGALAFGSADAELALGSGATTIQGGAGNATIFAGLASVVVNGGTGNIDYQGGQDDNGLVQGASVYGGAGAVTAVGAIGAGHNVFVAGAEASLLADGGYQSLLVAAAAGNDTLVASSGGDTLTGAGATGNNLYYASGPDQVIAGAGHDTVVLGPANFYTPSAPDGGITTVFAGNAGSTGIFASSERAVVVGGANTEYVQAGTGPETVFAGSGVDGFGFVDGQSGGTAAIIGFAAQDRIELQGYGAGAVQAALGAATVSGGNTTLALADNTRITLFGVTNLTAASFG